MVEKKQRTDTGPERCIWPFGWSICCSLKPHQKSSPWKDGCQEAIPKEGKWGERAEVCQMTQELDRKSMETGLMKWWILRRAPHRCSSVGSSWQRTEEKAANIQRRALICPSGSLENYSWRLSIHPAIFIPAYSNLVSRGGRSLSQLPSAERWGTPWTGRLRDKWDEQPSTLTSIPKKMSRKLV